jgi:hypothetical protein
MYVLTDKITDQVLGRFENLTEARGTLLDFYRLHPPGGRWLEIAIEHEPRDLEPEPRDFKLPDAA